MRLRDHDLVLREIDGETVLLDLAGSTYFAVNRTGTFLLELLRDDQDRESLVDALARQFELGDDQAAADTDAFLTALREQDLLV
ncbi:PqqD family protein [Nocardioides xinjiangensis]|uniref:PqqD family protein n=1 Tax=Nocardioides xinjiangensis TaxID=2817376 RepID=UPI001B312EDB|nr:MULTISPECIES: PqqD family protein [unclassified Nocardioides]